MRSVSTRVWVLGFLLLAAFNMGPSCMPQPPAITVTSPAHGAFSTAANVTIAGTVANVQVANVQVKVNGQLATLNPDRTWSITLPLDPVAIVNPFMARLENLGGGLLARQRIVVHAASSVADGAFSSQGVALRLNDTGLDQVEPVIEGSVNFNLATLLPVGTTVIPNQCFLDSIFGCIVDASVKVINNPNPQGNPPAVTPATSGFSLDVDSMTNFAFGDIDIFDLAIDLLIDANIFDCTLRLSANSAQFTGDYALSPASPDPSNIDVNLQSPIGVLFNGFDDTFTGGACTWFLIGDIIQAAIGSIEPQVVNGIKGFLGDPDGAGAQDSPIADAIEVALADISITGPIGEALQVNLESPLFDVLEDPSGITLGSNVRVQSSVGSGPGQCQPPAGVPNLAASFHVAEAFPSFSGVTQHMALAISTSAFNQLLKAQVECGLLQTQLTEIDLGGGPLPITAGTLSLLIPQLAILDPEMPMHIDLRPSLAPFLTGNAGPGGEIGEFRVAHYEADVIGGLFPLEAVYLSGAIDFRAGLDMSFDQVASSLTVSIGSVTPGDITVAILENPINTNEAQLQVILPTLLAQVLPDLGEGLGAFPIPAFLGLQIVNGNVSRTSQFYTLAADLAAAP
jgi:hypothetical protein